jgi:hypothetical protein
LVGEQELTSLDERGPDSGKRPAGDAHKPSSEDAGSTVLTERIP